MAAWTTLRIRWSITAEWRSRAETRLLERFYEQEPDGSDYSPGDVVKVLDPQAAIPHPTRAILMVRDPQQVVHSATTIGQRLSVEQVQGRLAAFRVRFAGRLDEVQFTELDDLPTLFGRLGAAGWPVAGPARYMTTWAAR